MLKNIFKTMFNFYRDITIREDKYSNELTILKDVKVLRVWDERDFYKYYYKAYIGKNGIVYLIIERYFIDLKEIEFHRYETKEKFMEDWFPKAKLHEDFK